MLCNVPLCLLKNVSVLPLFIAAKYLIHCYTLGPQSLLFLFNLQIDLFVVILCGVFSQLRLQGATFVQIMLSYLIF